MNRKSKNADLFYLFIYKLFSLFSPEARKWEKKMEQNKLNASDLFINDDESCPCGSDRVFKDCCKTKADLGPTKSIKPTSVILGEEIKKARKGKKICIHPDKSKCKGNIKKAHALQNHKILSLLAEGTGHVYCIDKNKNPLVLSDNPEDPMVIGMFEKTSVNTATTSTCFCDYHDTVAFSVIESGAPDFDPLNKEMKFVYAYKAFSFDYFNFIFEFSQYRELFKKRPSVFCFPEQVKYYRMLQLKEAELEPIKKHFDSEILCGSHNGIHTCILEIPYQIKFATYAFIAPDFDIDGQLINNTIDGVMHRIAITVFPEKTKSYILMSCLETEKVIYQDLFFKIKTAHIDKVTYYFSMMIPLYSENIIIAKSLWESYDEYGQMGLTHLINLHGGDMVLMSRTIAMGLQNESKNKKFNYSHRPKIDLFKR